MLSKWDYRWLGLAKYVSQWSKDPSTQVGAVVARGKDDLAFGYNGFPESCPDHEDLYRDRPTKYKLVTHAEINAIIKANSKGRDVKGSTVYTYPLPPCATCASYLAAAGITRVVALVDHRGTNTPTYHDFSDTEYVLKMNGISFNWSYVE